MTPKTMAAIAQASAKISAVDMVVLPNEWRLNQDAAPSCGALAMCTPTLAARRCAAPAGDVIRALGRSAGADAKRAILPARGADSRAECNSHRTGLDADQTSKRVASFFGTAMFFNRT
jgi:hypothetical protein